MDVLLFEKLMNCLMTAHPQRVITNGLFYSLHIISSTYIIISHLKNIMCVTIIGKSLLCLVNASDDSLSSCCIFSLLSKNESRLIYLLFLQVKNINSGFSINHPPLVTLVV
jgi:hypothetical protein